MKKLLKLTALAILISLVSFAPPGIFVGQPHADEYRISVDVGMVVLPVIVTDRRGKAVAGLNENNFHVFEDGCPQKISLFESEDVPMTVGLVIDNSGSMWAKRPEVLAAAEDFAKSSNPHDQIFVVNFNQSISMGLPKGVPFTSDIPELLTAISRSPAAGKTALYDGLGAALDHLKAGTENRKALLVISDGGDNASRLSIGAVLHRAEASNAQIYAIGVFDENFTGENSGVLRRLARVTGGQSYFPNSVLPIPGICEQIARNLRHQYTIGYHPTDPDEGGKYHAIHVTASAAGAGKLRVSTRAGYVTPGEAASMPAGPAKASS